MKVVGQVSQVITEEDINKKLLNGKKAKESVQNRQVVAKMLPLDWVFKKYGDKENVGFRELIIALSESSFASLFSTELVITLNEHFWKRYSDTVFYLCFVPFCVYFLLVQIFLSVFVINGINKNGTDFEKYGPHVMGVIIVLHVAYFLFFELVVMLRTGYAYFLDVYNFVDLASFTLNVILVYHAFEHPYKTEISDEFRNLTTIASILMWLKVFYWMRLFTPTAFYVKLITETLYDIRYFLILFVTILMTFATSLMIANSNRKDELYTHFFNNRFLDAIMN